MHRILLGCLLAGLIVGAGCEGVVGPFQRCAPPVRPDNPCLPIGEQEKIGRAELALPQKSPAVAPRTYAEEPTYRGYSTP
jgi:hypothetical protein